MENNISIGVRCHGLMLERADKKLVQGDRAGDGSKKSKYSAKVVKGKEGRFGRRKRGTRGRGVGAEDSRRCGPTSCRQAIARSPASFPQNTELRLRVYWQAASIEGQGQRGVARVFAPTAHSG